MAKELTPQHPELAALDIPLSFTGADGTVRGREPSLEDRISAVRDAVHSSGVRGQACNGGWGN